MPLALEFAPIDRFGLGPLALAALAGRPEPAHLDLHLPRRAEEVVPPDEVDPELLERTELVELLRAAATDTGPFPAPAEEGLRSALGRAQLPGAWFVLCGQQPGLGGGALLDAVKTLHTVRLARDLERHFARPVVPVFWNHGDDHDADEANNLRLVNVHLDPVKVGLPNFGASRFALWSRPVQAAEQSLDAVLAQLRTLLPSGARTESLLHLLLPRHGDTLVAARTRAWLELFGAHGLLVLESHRLGTASGRALARLVLADPQAALDRARTRLDAGGMPQPEAAQPPALLFHMDGGLRRAVRRYPLGWRLDGEDAGAERTDEELASIVRAQPGHWSAGALLRPLVQDLLVPVAAYVGGPGELAYQAHLGELRRAAGVQRGNFVLRSTVLITTPRLREAAERSGINIVGVMGDPSLLKPKKDQQDTPLVLQKLREAGQRHRAEMLELRREIAALDPGLAQRLRRVVSLGEKQLGEVQGRLQRVFDNRRGKNRRHLRRVGAMVWPLGRPQERVLGLLAFLAAAGDGWLGELLEGLDPFPTEGVVVHLDGDLVGWL